MGADHPNPRPAEAATAPAAGASRGGSDSFPIGRLPQRLGRYTLTRRLGVGGMAEVFLAQQDGPAGFHKTCVVKRILPHLAEEPRFVDMFQREARLAALLHHTNVVQIYELGEADGSFFISMEFVDGLPLHRLARGSWRANQPLPMEVVCCAIADAALGLAAAHEQCDEQGQPLHLVHRDISPDNLIINREGVTKILDFGVAKSTQGERTATGEIKGKVPFLSPEQVRGDPVDSRSDLYSLGVTAYWLLTGKRPFTAPSDLGIMQAVLAETPRPPRALNPTVPEPLDELVMRLLDKDPARRPQSGHDVADALAPALSVRRAIVSPFVREVLTREQQSPPVEESGPANPGFLPSTPHSDEVKSNLRRLANAPTAARGLDSAALASPGRTMADETAPTAPSAADPASIASVSTESLAELLPRSRAPLVAATLGGLVLIGAAVLFVATRDPVESPAAMLPATSAEPAGDRPTDPAPPPALPPADPTAQGAAAPAPVEPAPAAPSPAAPVAAESAPAEPVDPATAEPAIAAPPEPKAPKAAKEREIAAAAPKWVQWQTKAGKKLGAGATVLKLPAGVAQLVAVDTRRGARSLVDVVEGAVDYGRLGKGRLDVRAAPFADVFLGAEALGGTPFKPVELVAGSYVVTFRHDGKEKTERVEIKAGQTAKVMATFD